MSSKSANAKNSRFTLYCPITKKSVTKIPREQLAISDGQTNWWHCPECNGWHVSITPNERFSPVTNQFRFESVSK